MESDEICARTRNQARAAYSARSKRVDLLSGASLLTQYRNRRPQREGIWGEIMRFLSVVTPPIATSVTSIARA